MIIYTPTTKRIEDNPKEHYRKLLFQLRDTIDTVACDHRLAMYRAQKHGLSLDEIAHHAGTDVDDVRDAIATLSREADVEEWAIAASWAPRYEYVEPEPQ
jgi:hypothetical protein